MNQNPYAQNPYGGAIEAEYAPTRTSVMAILSIVFSLICILPGTGLIGILLGIGALAAIGRSDGRLEGKGAALSGIILGLITTVLWGAVVFGGLQGWTFYTKRMTPVGDRFFQALTARDLDAARAELTVEANESLTDERLLWFTEEIESRIGPVQGAATSFDTMGQAFGAVFGPAGRNQSPNSSVTVNQNTSDAVVPVGVIGDSGSLIAWLVFDEQTLAGGPKTSPKVIDVFLQFSNQEMIVLRESGPGRSAAQQMNMGAIVEEEEPSAAPDAPALRESDGEGEGDMAPEETTEPAPRR